MLKVTHERIGILTPLLFMLLGYYYFDERITMLNGILLLIFSFLGSTFPDIDQTHSTSGQRFFLIAWMLKFWQMIGEIFHIEKLRRMTGHRGITHSVVIPILIYSIYAILNYTFHFYYSINYMVNGFFIGIGTHLLIDMFNPGGIPVFAPFSFMKIRIAKIKTGSENETVFRRVVTFAFLLTFVYVFIYRSDGFYQIIGDFFEPQTYTNLIKNFWNWLGSF